jgi:hypothetical protein
MEAVDSTDKGVGLPVLFVVVAVLGAVGLAAFGLTGDQTASGWSFAVAMAAGSLAVASYHLHA